MTSKIQYRAGYAHLGGVDLAVFRWGGPGLGNLLFPWARCVIWTERSGVPMLAPVWPQLKLGPLLRGERDLRGYAHHFQAAPGDIGGLSRLFLLGSCKQSDEDGQTLSSGLGSTGEIVRFSGLRDYFGSLRGASGLLLRRLRQIVQPGLVPEPLAPGTLAVHFRCGDFRPATKDEESGFLQQGLPNQVRIPLPQLVRAVQDVREVVGQVPVRVYSDGADEEIGALLALPDAVRAPRRAAISDLLEMATASLLIQAPHSTFSMWGAFLGDVPTIGFPEAGGRCYGWKPFTRALDSDERRQMLRATIQAAQRNS